MTSEQLLGVVESVGGSPSDGGWQEFRDQLLTVHASAGGALLSFQRIGRVKLDGAMLYAKTARGQTHVVRLEDVFGLSVEPSENESRKAGFV